MKLHGREIQVGDRVWCEAFGWMPVEAINPGADCPIITKDLKKECSRTFRESGHYTTARLQSYLLLWNEFIANPADIEPPKPMEIWVNVYDDQSFGYAYATEKAGINAQTSDCTTKKFIEVME